MRARALGCILAIAALLVGACGEENSSPASGYERLEARPLKLPMLGAEEARMIETPGQCLRGERAVGAIAVPGIRKEAALGPGLTEARLKRGPAYVALAAGPPRIVLLSSAERIGGSPWRWAIKTIVISRPPYQGPVLVRGARLHDSQERLRFGSGKRPGLELELPAGSWRGRGLPLARGGLREGWRAQAATTRLTGPGCHAFQIDGEDFSYALSFAVQGR